MKFRLDEIEQDTLYVSIETDGTDVEFIGKNDKHGYVIARINSAGEVSLSKGGCKSLGLKIQENS